MRCLVTGGAGFIGSNLVRALLERGHFVRVLDNFATGKLENLGPFLPRIEWIEGDLRSYHIVSKVTRDIDIIFHQGALGSVPRSIRDPLTTNQVNVEGTLNVLDAAKRNGVRRVVFASSASTYGNQDVMPLREDMSAQPLSPYGVSKLAGESYCRSFSEVYGLETVSLRYFNVFGPAQLGRTPYTGAIAIFVTSLIDRKPITLHGDGEQTKDFTYVDNVVQANLLAAERPGISGESFNIACGHTTSVIKVLHSLMDLVGHEVPVIHMPSREGDIQRSQADIQKAKTLLGYEPGVDVFEGLKRSVKWYLAAEKP
jgi:UDP-glucose 4-epimerase